MRTVRCAFCGKEVELPPVLGDAEDGIVDVIEDGKIIRSTLKDGELVRDPEPIPAYHIGCFQAAFGTGTEVRPKPPVS